MITSGTDWETKNMFPAVGIAQVSPTPLPAGEAGLVIAEPSLRAATIMPQQVPQYAVEIRDVEGRKLVTLIELLSPANKQGEGYDEYITKGPSIINLYDFCSITLDAMPISYNLLLLGP
jgi:hypothetical protein